MKLPVLLSLLFCGNLCAQIINTAPYILTVDELKAWTQNGPTASTDLISTVPLATRFTNPATQFNPSLTNDMQIAYLPDGMNNFANYHGEQSQFNLYNFTHWAYIDKLVWFGGTSSQSIQLPSSPWTNAAHKNGVKVFGNVFFAPTAFGGSTATLQNFLEQDAGGNFIAVPKMVEIMQYYHFDGWFVNQETATTATVAGLMHDFMRDLTTAVEAVGKEVMWYDAMRLNGAVGWQNRLNLNNSPFVQDDADGDGTFETRVGSSIFINFFWASNSFPTMSRTRAQTIGRSQYEVFTGADIWPNRNQGDFLTGGNTFMGYLHENATTPFTSLGLFAPNCIYNHSMYSNFNNDVNDHAAFYAAENKMFAGADQNPAIVDATGWKGFSNWIPEASVISGFVPFATNFNTGHGLKKFENGLVVSDAPWHDMNQQDILPTWQWAFSQSDVLEASWDFEQATDGGSSLKITGSLPQGNGIDLMLYKTYIPVTGTGATTTGNLLYKTNDVANNGAVKVILTFADAPTQKYEVPGADLVTLNGWTWKELDLGGFANRDIATIGLRFSAANDIVNFQANIGSLLFDQAFLGTKDVESDANFVTVTYPNDKIMFGIYWPNTASVDCEVYDLQGKNVRSKTIELGQATEHQFDRTGLRSGVYIVQFKDQKNTVVTKKIVLK
ncbi:endo-beta-N-acetylglucosaminidase [Flavobacterium caeni]|uniref:endo-beta-N-acetylglucosaminidase n=1 Tax=Flavobacterium caeni TaxID=490189 RepID=UPI000B82EAFB|nr:T9SS type A sorting domain-containing protein [Flavobacterium caeni]